jgi:hypothetical protein
VIRALLAVVCAAATLVLALLALGAVPIPQQAAASCAPRWRAVPLPTGKGERWLTAVAALDADDVWAVGSIDRDRPLAMHWNGVRWRSVPIPGEGELDDVSAVSPNDVWAVGTTTDIAAASEPLILHWDGKSWTRVKPAHAPKTQLKSVAAVSRSDVWVAGGTFSETKPWVAHLQHWDGKRWQRAQINPDRPPLNDLVPVSGESIWAVGGGEHGSRGTSPAILHWTGNGWTPVRALPFGSANVRVSLGLNAVSAAAADDVWAVGELTVGPLVEHWNGRTWRRMPVPFSHWQARYKMRENSWLRGVAALSPDNVWAVGFGIEHWNGKRWTRIELLTEEDGDLFDIAAVSPTDIWAVGEARVLRYSCGR